MSTPWPENPKFCKDCKWLEVWNELCQSENCLKLSLISGMKYKIHALEARSVGACGIEARYFEPKEQKL